MLHSTRKFFSSVIQLDYEDQTVNNSRRFTCILDAKNLVLVIKLLILQLSVYLHLMLILALTDTLKKHVSVEL